MTHHIRNAAMGLCLLGLLPGAAMAEDTASAPATGAAAWINEARAYLQLRYRYEYVDQAGLPNNAHASTMRVRFGVESGKAYGLSLLAEGLGVLHLGNDLFNDTTNQRVTYPVVADPELLVLNQLALRWTDGDWIRVSVGRQAMNWDNQRWIGSVGWRQNDQTMDAGVVTLTLPGNFEVSYGGVWRVNRIFGPDSAQGVWRNNSIHLVRAAYNTGAWGTLTVYGYFLDIPDAPAASSQTFGLRWAGKADLGGDVTGLFAAEYARQSDHGANPASFGLDYFLIEPGIAYGPLTVKLGYEHLGSNGAVGLQTPLATLHAFNGWADRFLATPATGLRDFYADAAWRLDGPDWLKGTMLRVIYHDFRAASGGLKYGTEWNALISRRIFDRVTLTAKFADYNASGFATNTTKGWLMVDVSF